MFRSLFSDHVLPRQGLYGDEVEEIDWSVREIRRALRETGLEQKTLVILTSDNGPRIRAALESCADKNTTYEGGVRELFIAAWPGKIRANSGCDGLASMLDIFPRLRGCASHAACETARRQAHYPRVAEISGWRALIENSPHCK